MRYAFVTPQGFIRKVINKPDPRDNPLLGERMLPYDPPAHDVDMFIVSPQQPVAAEAEAISFTLTPREDAAERVKNARIARIQEHLDRSAQAKGYDSILSAVTYGLDPGSPFYQEGLEFARWRSACWARGFEILDEVTQGLRPIPSNDELIALLPTIEV